MLRGGQGSVTPGSLLQNDKALLGLDEFPVFHLHDDHGVFLQAVMVFRGDVIDA